MGARTAARSAVRLVALVTALAVVTGCGAAEPLRSYDDSGGWTSEFKAAVAGFVTAVQNNDAASLKAMNGGIGTDRGVGELLARYGGDRLSVTGYDGIMPGDGFAHISVTCPGGKSQTFLQPFDGLDGNWHAVIYSAEDLPTTEESLPPDAARSIDPSRPDPVPTKPAPATGLYPPCQ